MNPDPILDRRVAAAVLASLNRSTGSAPWRSACPNDDCGALRTRLVMTGRLTEDQLLAAYSVPVERVERWRSDVCA